SLAAAGAVVWGAVRHFSSPQPGAGHLTRSDDAVGEGLALVQARGPDEAERRPFRELGTDFAVVGQGRQTAGLVHAVDALVRDEGARPLLVVPGIVLDEEHLRRLVD